MLQKKLILILMTVFIVILAGCSTKDEANHQHEEAPVGDIREQTNGITEMPQFLSNKPEEMQSLYMAVANHKELVESMPCYCGCGDSVGHNSNYNCFIHENKEDGTVVWDDHGTKCKVCLDTAAFTISEFENGKSPLEIRKAIDEAYGESNQNPTPTPMPETN